MPRRILLVESTATNRILWRVKLQNACYDVQQAASGAEAIALIKRFSPELILLDESLPDICSYSLCAKLKGDPVTSGVPILILGAEPHPEKVIEALTAGADDRMLKPLDERLLLARIRSLLRSCAVKTISESFAPLGFGEDFLGFARQAKIALITDRANLAMRWRTALLPYLGMEIVPIDRATALRRTLQPPDLYLIQVDPASEQGMQIISELNCRAEASQARYCLVMDGASPAEIATALDMGADAVLAEGFHPAEIALRTEMLVMRKRDADRHSARVSEGLSLALADPLTGLCNRRYAIPALTQMLEGDDNSQHFCSVMALDIDRFKSINDRFGHAAGDAVLVEFSRRLAARIGGHDIFARVGGEEFLVVSPNHSRESAASLARELCCAVSSEPFQLPHGSLWITVSIGLALTDQGKENGSSILERADTALLCAKREGRNQVMLSEARNAA